METDRRAAVLAATLMAVVALALFACTPHEVTPSTEGAFGSTVPMPGVEVEILAARRGGRGDAYVFFLLGQNGQVQKEATLGFGSIDLLSGPRHSNDPTASEAPPASLSSEDADALRATIERAILAASTPELFDPPPAFAPPDGRVWRRVDPPVRLRVDPAWLAERSDRLDGFWVALASPVSPLPERVVVNVVGWLTSIPTSTYRRRRARRGRSGGGWHAKHWTGPSKPRATRLSG